MCTIGRSRVFSLGRWSSRIPTGFLVSRGTWVSIHTRVRPFVYGTITLFGWTFQTIQLGWTFLTRWRVRNPARTDPATPTLQRLRALTQRRCRLFPVRSPLLRESLLPSLPPGTKMFQFPGLAPCPYVFRTECGGINRHRFSDSGISGSKPVSGSPKLIAASHALHRLRAPRHPPYALSSLIMKLDDLAQ